MKNSKTFYEELILQSIDFSGYEYQPSQDFTKVNQTYNRFLSEYGWAKTRMSEKKAFEEWLRGLPSVITIPFYNSDILNRAYLNGIITADASEETEDKFLEEYWANMTNAFFTLKDNL